jgi:DNA-binding HxlR family transcriptional regulator
MRPGFGIGAHRPRPVEGSDWDTARTAIELISGKWVVPIVAALFAGPRRQGELRRRVGGGISDKVLTETLRRMERDGLLTRRVVEGEQPAVFYALTSFGRSLAVPLAALAGWLALRQPGA